MHCCAVYPQTWKYPLDNGAFVIKAAKSLQKLNILISSLLKHHISHTRAV